MYYLGFGGRKLHTEAIPSPENILFEKAELLSLLALLVCNAARGLASGLAGSLALAAAAVLYGLSNILSINGFDSAHCYILRSYDLLYLYKTL